MCTHCPWPRRAILGLATVSSQQAERALELLTAAECEVLYWLCQNLTREEIAKRRTCEVRTIDEHLAHIYHKFELTKLEPMQRRHVLAQAVCPVHLRQIHDPTANCASLHGRRSSPKREPLPDTLALVRRDQETGVIPIYRDIVIRVGGNAGTVPTLVGGPPEQGGRDGIWRSAFLAAVSFALGAVAVLLALLFLGVKGIRLGPTLPAFLSPTVAEVLVDKFDIKLIGTVQEDIEAIMAGK